MQPQRSQEPAEPKAAIVLRQDITGMPGALGTDTRDRTSDQADTAVLSGDQKLPRSLAAVVSALSPKAAATIADRSGS
jgi:hypothetical protein